MEPTRRKSRAEVELEATLAQLKPGSVRYTVVQAAQQFRASWVDLGRSLTEVRERSAYKAWGYPSFEAYCRRELKLRSDTANKLTRSFSFLRDHQPQAVETEIPEHSSEVPALDVVDLLTRAKERTKLSERDLATVQAEVLSPEGPSTRHQVVKRFRDFDPDAFRTDRAPKATEASVDVRKALLLAERLEALLSEDAQTSKASKEAMGTIVRELRGRFEERRLSA